MLCLAYYSRYFDFDLTDLNNKFETFSGMEFIFDKFNIIVNLLYFSSI